MSSEQSAQSAAVTGGSGGGRNEESKKKLLGMGGWKLHGDVRVVGLFLSSVQGTAAPMENEKTGGEEEEEEEEEEEAMRWRGWAGGGNAVVLLGWREGDRELRGRKSRSAESQREGEIGGRRRDGAGSGVVRVGGESAETSRARPKESGWAAERGKGRERERGREGTRERPKLSVRRERGGARPTGKTQPVVDLHNKSGASDEGKVRGPGGEN